MPPTRCGPWSPGPAPSASDRRRPPQPGVANAPATPLRAGLDRRARCRSSSRAIRTRCERTARRSRRPARRSSRTSRTTRSRRQQHGVAGLGARVRRRAHRVGHRRRPSRPGAARRRRRRPRRPPRRWPTTARTRSARRRPGRRGRVPCCGRRRSARPSSKPAGRRRAWRGASVAFESSYQAHAVGSPTELTRWGSPSKPRSACAHAVERSRPGRERRWPTAASALRCRAGARAAARRTPTSRGRPTGPPAGPRRRGSRPMRRARRSTVRRRGRAWRAITTGSSALATATPSGPEVAPDPGLGRARRRRRMSWPVEVVLGEVQPGRRPGPEASGVAEPERRGLDHEHVDVGVVDGVDQRDVGVAGGDGAAAPTPRASRSTSVVTVVLPSVPVTATQRAGRPTRRPGRTRCSTRHRRPPGRREHGMAVGHAGAGQHRVGRVDERSPARCAGGASTRSTPERRAATRRAAGGRPVGRRPP